MNTRCGSGLGRAGVTTADSLLVLAALALALSLVVPRIRRTDFRRTVEYAIRDVEQVQAAALGYRRTQGRFPPDAKPGEVPEGLRALLSPDAGFAREKYTLDWEIWERATRPEDPHDFPLPEERDPAADTISSPPMEVDTFAGITVHTTRKPLLAALLRHFGDRSFARGDRWTLMLPAKR